MNETKIAELVRRIETDLAELKAELAGITNRVHRFVETTLYRVADSQIAFTDFYRAFRLWLPEGERGEWPKARVIQELAPFRVIDAGRPDQPRKMIVGLSLIAPKAVKPDNGNPDYDELAMFKLVRRMYREERLGLDAIATKLNELGHRDRYGREWDWLEVRQVDAD